MKKEFISFVGLLAVWEQRKYLSLKTLLQGLSKSDEFTELKLQIGINSICLTYGLTGVHFGDKLDYVGHVGYQNNKFRTRIIGIRQQRAHDSKTLQVYSGACEQAKRQL